MKVVGYVAGACVVLAAMQALAAALTLGIVLAIIVGAITRPREMAGMLVILILGNFAQRYPLTCFAIILLLSMVVIVSKSD
jgi:hypothetical protein